MNNELSLPLILTSLLLVIRIVGCGTEDTIREPEIPEADLPVIDIGAHDIAPSYFVYRLVIEPATQGQTFVSKSVTYTGYVYDDWRNQFTIHVPTPTSE